MSRIVATISQTFLCNILYYKQYKDLSHVQGYHIMKASRRNSLGVSKSHQLILTRYCRAPFFKGYKFHEWSKKEVYVNYFQETTLEAPFTIHVNLNKMEFSLKQISWKSRKSAKFMPLKKERPTVLSRPQSIH